jgi:hypothetical protein
MGTGLLVTLHKSKTHYRVEWKYRANNWPVE